jgi:hypothetical protein
MDTKAGANYRLFIDAEALRISETDEAQADYHRRSDQNQAMVLCLPLDT